MSAVTPFWRAGSPWTGTETFQVRNPYDDALLATVAYADAAAVRAAVADVASVADEFSATSAGFRADVLDSLHRALAGRSDEVAQLITAESGKPIKWATVEVTRALSTLRFAAEEARRDHGEIERLDTDPAAQGRFALTRRFPYGPVLGITPFNFPLNLVMHKLAPAIAVGAPIIVKPSPRTPLSALLLGELLADTALPPGAVSVLPIPNEVVPDLVAQPELPVISFTGSVPVGWGLAAAEPRKQVLLELGGNAAAVIAPDYSNIEWAASRIATFGNYQAGQSCIAVQRVFIDSGRFDQVSSAIVAAVRGLQTGDPADPATEVGPLIDAASADRVQAWVAEAVAAGATVLTGGERDGNTVAPVVLTNVDPSAKVAAEEVFGPVLVLAAYDDLDEAFAAVNNSQFGLQAGVFTNDTTTAFAAHRALKVGGVVIGDVPSFRADQMPYGGVKASGVGREGVRYAMADFTYPKVMVFTGLPL